MSLYNFNSDGFFGLCSGYWDEKSRTFKGTNETEKADCCLRTCKPFINECVKQCPNSEPKNRKSCYKSCDDIKEICEDNCQLSNNMWGVNNPIYKGTEQSGCGNGVYTTLNKKCILDNKEKIIKICEDNCSVNCKNHCIYSYNLISNKNSNPLSFNIPINTKKTTTTSTTAYIIYALSISGIIFGIYILWILKNR